MRALMTTHCSEGDFARQPRSFLLLSPRLDPAGGFHATEG